MCSTGTKEAMDKARRQLDSSCLKDPETPLHQILIVVGICFRWRKRIRLCKRTLRSTFIKHIYSHEYRSVMKSSSWSKFYINVNCNSHLAQFGAIRLTFRARIRAHILRQFHHENASTLHIRECEPNLTEFGRIWGFRFAWRNTIVLDLVVFPLSHGITDSLHQHDYHWV